MVLFTFLAAVAFAAPVTSAFSSATCENDVGTELKNDTWGNILIGSSVGISISSLITYGIAEKKLYKAVHNYNLYVVEEQIHKN
jgi:hypothetical protein